jgi:hypothetical protein
MPRALLATFVIICACSGSSPGGGDDDDDTADAAVQPATGCDGTALLANPEDPSAPGPWRVGVRTATIGRLTVEVWYPAAAGGPAGQARRYDIREHLPASQRAKVPDADNPWQDCDCYPDLEVDAGHGPYPVILFVHGTASFRTQSLTHATHWASRGFVVLAADHPGLMLGDLLSNPFTCPGDTPSGDQDLAGDVDAVLAAVRSPAGTLAFLSGRIDAARIALVGHSAGGGAVAGLADRDGVKVVMPFSSGMAVAQAPGLEATMFVSGMNDAVADFASVESGFAGSPAPKHLVGIADAGHLVVTDLCALQNAGGENMLEVAQRYEVCGTQLAGGLFDCEDFYIDGPTGWAIVNYATSAILETTLHCTDRSAALAQLADRFDQVGEYRTE